MLKQIKRGFLFFLFCFLAGSIHAQNLKPLTAQEMMALVNRAVKHVKGPMFESLEELNAMVAPHIEKKSPFYPTLPPHTPESVMKIAYEAAQYVARTGDISELNKKQGKFTRGEFLDYRYAMILNCGVGELLVHPWIPGMVCKKGLVKKFKDAKGKLYILKACLKSRNKPEGSWVMSFQTYPNSIEPAPMALFSIRFKDSPYMISSIGREIELSEEDLDRLAENYRRKDYPKIWPDKVEKIENPCEEREEP